MSRCGPCDPPIPIEYLILERCGFDFSALRQFAQSLNGGKGEPLLALEFARLGIDALQQFHQSGYVHRDIKPSNFLTLTPEHKDFHSRILITDFGLSRRQADLKAKPHGDPLHRTVGKSLYASFTSHDSRPQTSRDDIVSLMFVTLDLMFGRLPWKDLSNAKWNANGSKKSPEDRWRDVLGMKDRLLGSFVCARAAEEGEDQPIEWLTDPESNQATEYLPHEMRLLFHQLHNSPTAVDYNDIRHRLDSMISDLPSQHEETGQVYKSLPQLLDEYAKLQAEEETQRTADARRELEERMEQKRKADELMSEIKVKLVKEAEAQKAKKEQERQTAASAAASNASRAASTASVASAAKPVSVASKPVAPSAVSRTYSAVPVLPPKPKPFDQLSFAVRTMLGQALQLSSALSSSPPLDLTQSNPETGVYIYATPDPLSLDSLWNDLSWSQVASAAQTRKNIGTAKFEEWDGNWNVLIQGFHSLESDQYPSLVRYLRGVFANYPIPLQPQPPLDTLKVAIPAAIAHVYNLMQKAKRGLIAIPGFGHANGTPKPTAANPPSRPIVSVKSNSSTTPTTPVVMRKIPKKVVVIDDENAPPPETKPTPPVLSKEEERAKRKAKSLARKEKRAAKEKKKAEELKKNGSKKKKKNYVSSSSSSDSSSSDSEFDSDSDSDSSSSSSEDEALVVTRTVLKTPPNASKKDSSVKREASSSKASASITAGNSKKVEKSSAAAEKAKLPLFKRKAYSDDEPDSDEDEDSSEPLSASPTADMNESDSDLDSLEELVDNGAKELKARAPENKRTLAVKALQIERQKFLEEDARRREREDKLAKIERAAQNERKRRMEFEQEREHYYDIIRTFGSNQLLPPTITPCEFFFPSIFLETPAERRRRQNAEYTNLNNDKGLVRLAHEWQQKQFQQWKQEDQAEAEAARKAKQLEKEQKAPSKKPTESKPKVEKPKAPPPPPRETRTRRSTSTVTPATPTTVNDATTSGTTATTPSTDHMDVDNVQTPHTPNPRKRTNKQSNEDEPPAKEQRTV